MDGINEFLQLLANRHRAVVLIGAGIVLYCGEVFVTTLNSNNS